jgi:hypothetical protein
MRKNNTGICRVPPNAASVARGGDVLLHQPSVAGALDTGLRCTVQDPRQNKVELVSTSKGVSLFQISENMTDFLDALTNQLRTMCRGLDA